MGDRNLHPLDKNGNYDQRKHINDVWWDIRKQSATVDKTMTRVEKVDSIHSTVASIDNRLSLIYKIAIVMVVMNMIVAAYVLLIVFG